MTDLPSLPAQAHADPRRGKHGATKSSDRRAEETPGSRGMRKFVLAIGNARSGSTLLGSVLDSHANVLCANESDESKVYWRGLTREAIIDGIRRNSANNTKSGRFSEGYHYAIETPHCGEVSIYADKIWNPALLLLAGDRGLIERLAETMQAPVALVHCIRNPFDVIATMHKRSGATLEDRTRWYFMHCEAALSLYERGEPILDVRSETLIADPRGTSAAMFAWLGQPTDAAHLDRIAAVVAPSANRSRDKVDWPAPLIPRIERQIADYPFLAGYAFA